MSECFIKWWHIMTGLASHRSLWLNLGGTHEFMTEVWFAILMVDICTPSPHSFDCWEKT